MGQCPPLKVGEGGNTSSDIYFVMPPFLSVQTLFFWGGGMARFFIRQPALTPPPVEEKKFEEEKSR